MKARIIAAIALSIALTLTARAQVPGIINYQGRVVDNGTNFNGTGQFEFALVSPGGTTNYWSNDGTAVGQPTLAVSLVVTKGLYSVLLGDTTISNMTVAIPATIFANSNVLLRVWFNDGVSGFQQLNPDQRIAAVGYAMMAANVPNGAITASQLASNAITAANLAPGAVTATAIANGAVGADQIATNSVNSLIQSNLTTMGVLTTSTPQYLASNQYYLACAYLSTNSSAEGPSYGGIDLVTLVLAESADGVNFSLLSGINPNLNNGGALAVNVPSMWITNGIVFYTWEKNADFPTNVIPIASAPGFALPPARLPDIDLSSIGCTGTLGWIQGGNPDLTPGATVSNLFESLSLDGLKSTSLWMLTCTNLPYYTGWTQPTRIPILGGTFGLTNNPQGPAAFTYHGTNMLIYYDRAIYSNNATSILIATNTTAPGQAYSIWKSWDWGGWTTNGYPSGVVQHLEFPCPVFLPDRIRLYFEGTFTNQIVGGDTGFLFSYSDCFDDWTTWTPLRQCSLNLSNYFLRSVTVLPVQSTGELQNSISSRLGFYSPTNFTSGASVAGGLTADAATMTSLTVSNSLTFGRLVNAPWITSNAFSVLVGFTKFTVFADTTANAVSNVVLGVTGEMLFFSNIGTSTNAFTIDFGVTSTLTNNGSRYLSLVPMQHILVQKIATNGWASMGDNVFAGMTITNAPAVTVTNYTWGLVIGSDGTQYRVPLYK